MTKEKKRRRKKKPPTQHFKSSYVHGILFKIISAVALSNPFVNFQYPPFFFVYRHTIANLSDTPKHRQPTAFTCIHICDCAAMIVKKNEAVNVNSFESMIS